MHISPVLWQFLVKWLNDSALFPREASTIAPYADALYFFLLAITVIGLILVGDADLRLLDPLSQGRSIRLRSRWKARRCWRRPGRLFRWRSFWWCLCGARCCTSGSTIRRRIR